VFVKNIVISAFTPFGAYPANTSQLVAESLGRSGVSGFALTVVIFSATIPREDRGRILVDRALLEGASGIVSLGMASEKKGVCIESCARNAVDNMKYCPPELQKTPVDVHAVYGARLPLDLTPWNIPAFEASCRDEGIAVEHSTDAGGFCCNHLAWQTQRAVAQSGERISYAFIHIPCSPEAISDLAEFETSGKVSMSVERTARAVELLLRHAAI
jgi:pyroglutamyl-peptidase